MKMKKVVLSHIQFHTFVANLVKLASKGGVITKDCAWARARGFSTELYVPWDLDTSEFNVRVPNIPYVDMGESSEDGVFTKEYLESLTIVELQEIVGNKTIRNKKKLIEIYFAAPEESSEVEQNEEETGEA